MRIKMLFPRLASLNALMAMACVIVIAFICTPQMARGDQKTPVAKPAVGVFGRDAWPIIEHLRDRGFPCTYLYYGSEQTESSLRRFHVIVLAENALVNPTVKQNHPDGVTAAYDQKMLGLLKDYVEQGGGMLLYGGRDSAKPGSTNAYLSPWGAQLLEETIHDPTHQFQQRGGNHFEYNYTEEIAKHPITAGVQRIFYPLRSLYGQGNQALKLDENWALLLAGSKEAASHPMKVVQEQNFIDPDKPGTFATKPPLAAARNAGKGRLAIFAWNPVQAFFNYGHFMVGDIYFSKGGNGLASDGMKLLEQALVWLGQPSLPAGSGYGGYVNAPFREQPQYPKPINWSNQKIGGPSSGRRIAKGIVGARTALTGGEGTVADYVKAAETAGLQFIAFMEVFTQMDKGQWDAFRAECRKATTDKVLAVPGFAYPRGTARDIYFKVADMEWPQADMCSPDGKAVYNVEFDMMDPREALIGPFDISNIKPPQSPFWRGNAYNACAVATTKGGKTAWSLKEYLALVEIKDGPYPVAVDLIMSPAEVSSAAKRVLTCYLAKDQKDIMRVFNEPDDAFHSGVRSQIASGPAFTHIQAENAWRRTYGKNIPGSERVMVRVMAESEQPLKELEIYDGTRLFRRFKLSGNVLDLTFNTVHDHSHSWTYVLKDVAGGTAVQADSWTKDYFHYRFMCSDRQNTLASSYDIDKDGNAVNIAAAFQQPKSILRGCGFPWNAQIIARVPWHWDGCSGGLDNGICNPEVTLPLPVPEGDGKNPAIWGRLELPLSSRDVICQAASWDYATADASLAYSTHAELIPLETYQARARLFEFKKTPDSSAAMLIEGYYRMLTDGKFTPGNWWYRTRMSHSFYSFGGNVNELTSWVLSDPATGRDVVSTLPPKDKAINEFFTLSPGGYFALFDSQGSGAVFPLDRPFLMVASLHSQNMGRSHFGYDQYMNQSFKKGDIVPFRMVVYNGPVGDKNPKATMDQFRASFGLNGAPAYAVKAEKGKVLSMNYILDLQGENGGFAGTVTKADLQHRLPVRVHGVNPNWTCGIVDRTANWWLPTGVMADMPEMHGDAPGAKPVHTTYAAVELKVDRDIYLGNVVVSDKPEITLTLLPDGDGRYFIEAHNSSNAPVTARVSTVPEFNLCEPIQATIDVPAGESVMIGK